MKLKLIIVALFIRSAFFAQAQGFINLSFESAKFTAYPFGTPFVYASNSIPGWTPYLGGVAQDYIASNGVSLGGAGITIDGTNNSQGYVPAQGKYFMILFGPNYGEQHLSTAIGQAAQVPPSAQSILFWSAIFGSLDVSFNGNPLSLSPAGATTNNYTLYQADISFYAGQVGELLFSSPYGANAIIDNIQFSSTAVPEPGALALAALGALLLCLRSQREKNFLQRAG